MSSASSISSSTGTFNITGLASGVDTDKIIQGLMSIQQKRIDQLKSTQSQASNRQAAVKTIEVKTLTLQASLAGLSRSIGNALTTKTVSSSNEDVLTAAASTSAAAGSYTLKVNSLAQAAQLASQGFDSATSAIPQGTFQFRVGGGATSTVTIDGTNNTLQGLADAINRANGDVTAAVVNDGSDARTQPYRLLLTAKKAGASNTITVTNNLTTGGGASPEFSKATVGPGVAGASNTGTASFSASAATGGYTGAANDTYTFTVKSGGTVGTDAVQVSFTNRDGTKTGTITLNSPADVGAPKDVADGLQVQFGAGTLNAGDTFTVDAFVPTVQQATGASVTLGSGPGALTVQSDTNTVDGLIGGVTLNLKGVTDQPVTISVAGDTDAAKKAVSGFVDSYNDLMGYIDEQTSFDTKTNTAGLLLGDGSVAAVQDQIRRSVVDVVPGANPRMSTLSQAGITLDDNGHLVLDSDKFTQALTGGITGVTATDVLRLFALDGASDNPGVKYISGSDQTKAGATYQVDITRAASQATLTAAGALDAAGVDLDDSSNTLQLRVDGTTSGTITLASRHYTQLELAQAIQAQINADAGLAGRQVAVSVADGKLRIASQLFGSSSEVAVVGGTAVAKLGLTGVAAARGENVAGSFLVNGQAELATGSGQYLLGSSANANTADLQVRVLLAQDQLDATKPEANLTVTRGLASGLNKLLNGLLDPAGGRLHRIDDTYQKTIDDLTESINTQTQQMQAQQDALVARFTSMEETVNTLKNTGNYLAAQLSSLSSK